MKMVTLNHTDRAREIAAFIAELFSETHRGALRYWDDDNPDERTFCVLLFGNDGYAQQEKSESGLRACTKAYVHNLYAGLANLLPEGDVEFGTDEEGVTWVIVANFPRHEHHDDFYDEDADDDRLVAFWSDIVWQQWKSQMSFAGK